MLVDGSRTDKSDPFVVTDLDAALFAVPLITRRRRCAALGIVAGAIISGGKGTAAGKFAALEAAGVAIAASPAELESTLNAHLLNAPGSLA